MSDEKLFSEFDPTSYEQWYETTVKSLRGKDFDTLLTETIEGITLNPLYRKEDAAAITHQHSLPGEAPFVRGVHPENKPWWVAGYLPYRDPKQFNQTLKHDMARGQTAVFLDTTLTQIDSTDDLATALDGIDTQQTPVFIKTDVSGLTHLKSLNIAQGYINCDVLAILAETGKLSVTIDQAYDELATLLRRVSENSALDVLMVDTLPYHHAGANAVQELAFTLATGVETIRAMQEHGFDINTIAGNMCFNFAIGTQFFMEIAKLRAARLLWQQVVAAFGGDEDTQKMTIHAQTSGYDKTLSDAHNNIIRTTIEAFAAGVGGVQSLVVSSFDSLYQQPDDFSRRVARNQQLILQDEVHLSQVIDPVGGSWYAEVLTNELAKLAWTLFQQIEAQGGMFAALQAGFPQQLCSETAEKRLENLQNGQNVLVGTTKFVNEDETLPQIKTSFENESDQPTIVEVEALKTGRLEEKLTTISTQRREDAKNLKG